MEDKNIIRVHRDGYINVYEINMDISSWEVKASVSVDTGERRNTGAVHKGTPKIVFNDTRIKESKKYINKGKEDELEWI